MTIEETRQRILDDDEFVLKEVAKLQYLTGLKRVTRYHIDRAADDLSESVAEHVFAIQVLYQYFSKLENDTAQFDLNTVLAQALYLDADELETGDISTNLKTESDRNAAKEAVPKVIDSCPPILQAEVREAIQIHEENELPEAQFINAIDKLEGIIHCYQERNKNLFKELKFAKDDYVRTKERHIKPYPLMYRFYEVIGDRYEQEGFYYSPN